MTDHLEFALAEVYADGVLQETAADASLTRGELLRLSGTGALTGALGYFGAAWQEADAAAAKTKNDIAILRFDQVLEFLQSGLYTEAERLSELKAGNAFLAR